MQIVTFWYGRHQTGLAEHYAGRGGENPGAHHLMSIHRCAMAGVNYHDVNCTLETYRLEPDR